MSGAHSGAGPGGTRQNSHRTSAPDIDTPRDPAALCRTGCGPNAATQGGFAAFMASHNCRSAGSCIHCLADAATRLALYV